MSSAQLEADAPFRALIARMAQVVPAFRHIDSTCVLVVAGAARREARASIRPLTYKDQRRVDGGFEKPRITIDGRLMLYELCLRPRFFRCASAQQRLRIIAHELWHIDQAFDGTLAPERRHERVEPAEAERAVEALVSRFLEHEVVPSVLQHVGTLSLSAWLSRPPSRMPTGAGYRASYDERDLYTAMIEQL